MRDYPRAAAKSWDQKSILKCLDKPDSIFWS